jgi:hypothetical protein
VCKIGTIENLSLKLFKGRRSEIFFQKENVGSKHIICPSKDFKKILIIWLLSRVLRKFFKVGPNSVKSSPFTRYDK